MACWKSIKNIEDAEQAYLRDNKVADSPLNQLIDVFSVDGAKKFALAPLTKAEQKIPCLNFSGSYPWRPDPSDRNIYSSVVSREDFTRRFEIFTANQFDGWREWDNMVVIGGSVAACLTPIPERFEDNEQHFFFDIANRASDIDVFFYGLETAEQISQKLNVLYLFLKKRNNKVLVTRTPNTITFSSCYPRRNIQVVLGLWPNLRQLLFEPDIGVTCVAYNGETVLATSRAQYEYTHRCLIASPTKLGVRGGFEYISRLVKYSKRGFLIWDKELTHSMVKSSDDSVFVDFLIRMKGERPKSANPGVSMSLAFLIALNKHKLRFPDSYFFNQDSNENIDKQLVPFGRKYTFKVLRDKVQSTEPTVDGYGNRTAWVMVIDKPGRVKDFMSYIRQTIMYFQGPNYSDYQDLNYERLWYSGIPRPRPGGLRPKRR